MLYAPQGHEEPPASPGANNPAHNGPHMEEALRHRFDPYGALPEGGGSSPPRRGHRGSNRVQRPGLEVKEGQGGRAQGTHPGGGPEEPSAISPRPHQDAPHHRQLTAGHWNFLDSAS